VDWLSIPFTVQLPSLLFPPSYMHGLKISLDQNTYRLDRPWIMYWLVIAQLHMSSKVRRGRGRVNVFVFVVQSWSSSMAEWEHEIETQLSVLDTRLLYRFYDRWA
jgi:hypothetical protein